MAQILERAEALLWAWYAKVEPALRAIEPPESEFEFECEPQAE